MILLLTTLAAAADPAPASTPAPAPLSIPHEMYTLPNGLTVILAEDHSVPVVQVNVWYHVGSRDEVTGRTGFAHLFEHLMFQGSEHNNVDYFGPLQEVGAVINGTTNLDRTNYFEGVPSEYLPLALWGEADRMGWLVIDQERLDNQKLVVRNERRQSYENRPYGTAWLTILENTFPEGHPYHTATIGKHEDLDAATLTDVQGFFDTWYVPNNASLVICGDFDPAKAKELVELYFGGIPSGPEPTATRNPSMPLTEEKVIRQQEKGVPNSKVWMVWQSPALYAPGDADLDLLSTVLADGKDSRLYRSLVADKKIATDISAYQQSQQLVSMYMIEGTAAPGHTTDEIVAEVDRILAEIIAKGPTLEELNLGKVNYERSFIESLSTVAAKANILNSYFTIKGDPDWLQEDLDRYLAATPQSVQAAAAQYLGKNRVILHITPAEAK